MKSQLSENGNQKLNIKKDLHKSEESLAMIKSDTESSNFLQVIKAKPRSKSVPMFPPSLQNGEWSQKLTSPLSLTKIGENLQSSKSVLEDSFVRGEVYTEKKSETWCSKNKGINRYTVNMN